MHRVVGRVTFTCRGVKNPQVLSNELEQMSWLSCGSVDRLGITVAKLACECVGRKDVGHKIGLLMGVNKIPLRRSKTRQWKAWAEKIVVEEQKRGPWLEFAESVVFVEDVGNVITKAPHASAVSLVVFGVGRSKDYLIWRCCDPNNCLHCGLALRTKRRCVEFARSSAAGAEGTQGS